MQNKNNKYENKMRMLAISYIGILLCILYLIIKTHLL